MSPADNESDARNGVTVGRHRSAARSRFNIPDRVKGALITDVTRIPLLTRPACVRVNVIQEIDPQRVTNAAEAVEVSKPRQDQTGAGAVPGVAAAATTSSWTRANQVGEVFLRRP